MLVLKNAFQKGPSHHAEISSTRIFQIVCLHGGTSLTKISLMLSQNEQAQDLPFFLHLSSLLLFARG